MHGTQDKNHKANDKLWKRKATAYEELMLLTHKELLKSVRNKTVQ